MNKKEMVSIVIVVIFIIILLILKNRNNSNIRNDTGFKIDEKINSSSIVQDEETGEYVIYNKENGEEIARNPDKASLYIYEIDPDYNTGIFDKGEIVE